MTYMHTYMVSTSSKWERGKKNLKTIKKIPASSSTLIILIWYSYLLISHSEFLCNGTIYVKPPFNVISTLWEVFFFPFFFHFFSCDAWHKMLGFLLEAHVLTPKCIRGHNPTGINSFNLVPSIIQIELVLFPLSLNSGIAYDQSKVKKRIISISCLVYEIFLALHMLDNWVA